MADLSIKSAIGITVETTSGTFNAPNSTTDLLQSSDLKVAVNGITQEINEYTGSIHSVGPVVLGKTFDVTMKVYLRGPGGNSPPAAGAWVPGRVLRAAAFSETIVSAAIPASPEAIATGTTNSVTLGTSAAATQDLYKAMFVLLSGIQTGTAPRALTMLRSYNAAKLALLAETAAAAITGTYQIPKQLVYSLSPSSTVPTLSVSVWQGSRRWDGVGMAVSSFKMMLPVASRTNTALPELEVTLSGNLAANYDDPAPLITPGLAIPPFRDGKMYVAGLPMGGASLGIDFNATVAYPPNANQPNGTDPAQMAKTKRTVQLTLNQVLKATQDFTAIADGQINQAIMATYGTASGNFFGAIVTDARFDYLSPDTSGEYITSTGQAFVDGANKDITLAIAFYP